MKKIFSFALLLLSMTASAEKQQLTSPDGRIVVSVDLNDKGQPVYAVDYDGTPVVQPSLLLTSRRAYPSRVKMSVR